MLKRIAFVFFFLFIFIFALTCAPAFGQGVMVAPQTALKTVNGLTTPIAGATITVCAANTAGIPCSPALASSIFKDAALTQSLSNPFFADVNGNYQFAIAAGNYTVTVTSLGFAGQSYQITVGGSGSSSGGLADPGANGPVYRNGLNTTRPAISADVIALWSGTCNVSTSLRGDGTCGAAGAVSSVFGRTGAVVATLGDYNLALLNGGTAPAAQTYDFATNAAVVKAVTKALGTNTTDAASTQFVQTAINNAAFTKSGIFASAYGVVGEGHFNFGTTTLTSGNNIVTCTGCNFNTDATVGQAIYATNLQSTGAAFNTVIQLPETTILSIDSNTQIHTVGNANANNAGNAFLAWGTYEDTAFANAVTASYAACTTLNLPALNPEGDGPAVIFIKTAQFITDPNCVGSGGARTGWSLSGFGTNSTYIMPTPTFDSTTCNGPSSQCFGSTGSTRRVVLNYTDFSVFGGGNSQPGAGFASKVAFVIGATDNSFAHDVQLLFWGGNSSNGIGVGLELLGGEILTYNVGEDGFGKVGRKYATTGNLGPIQEVMPVSYDNGLLNLYVNTTVINPVFTVDGNYGGSGGQVACANNGSIWNSSNDEFGLQNSSQSGNNLVLLGFCTDGGGTTTGNATVHLSNDLLYGVGMGGGGHTLYTNATGDNVYVSNTLLSNTSGASTTLLTNNGSYFDSGGNTYTSTGGGTFTSGTGLWFGSESISGTALATVVATSNWGTSPTVGSLAGNSVDGQFTVTVGTTPGANPVATVTFPNTFLAVPTCSAEQIGGTQASAFVTVGTITATALPVTWVGTPTAANTIQIHYHCWN